MSNVTVPTFAEFNALSNLEIASRVPETVVYNVSGSRRAAVLAGVPAEGDVYAAWCKEGMMRCLKILFDHGIKNIIMPAVTPGLFSETTENYREHLWRWIGWVFTTDEAMVEFQDLGWNINIIFSEFIPELANVHEILKSRDHIDGQPSLWVSVIPAHNQLMEWMLKKLQNSKPVANSQEAIQLLYGSSILPAELYLDFGKPIVSPDVVPPFLAGIMNCYWTQQPGYSLTAESLRKILYDYLYVRKTWKQDKSGRTLNVLDDKEQWEQVKIIGLGESLGPYWYPAD